MKWITCNSALPRIEHRPLHPTRRRNSRLTIHFQFHLILAYTPPAKLAQVHIASHEAFMNNIAENTRLEELDLA